MTDGILPTPCHLGESDDWFIERDGRQYPDDPPLAADDKRTALIRRRQARQACRTDCEFRRQCLAAALDERPTHGTWGGYYSEELRALYREIDNPTRRPVGVPNVGPRA